MRTIRGRLTVSYAIALAATMLVFGVTIYAVERQQENVVFDNRLRREAEIIISIIRDAALDGPVVVSVPSPCGAANEEECPRRQRFLPARLLNTVQDYVIVLDTAGTILYTSEESRGLISNPGDFDQLSAVARNVTREQIATIDLGPPVGPVRYIVRPVTQAGPRVSTILYAASGLRNLSPFAIGMLVSGPIILLGAVFAGYLVTGRTMHPMDTIIDEIEAITDGRSLHRRVLEIETTEELRRLGSTLNNMLVRLERSFASLRRFTADASHELKTPLTVLRAGVERAITHPEATPEVLAVLEETLIEVNRMTELVDSLLMLARADEGRAPLHLERFDIRELLGEVSETASMLGEQARVNVRVDLPARPLIVAADRSRIRQLFMNLLTNAIKYTPAGGSVTVNCERLGESIIFEVSDTGIGIAAGELPHIFDRFWRADVARSRTGSRPGVGLGLAICKWIAEAHGGTIAASSRRGKGSTFTVTMPTGVATESAA